MTYGIRLQFKDGGAYWHCDCGAEGKVMRLAPGQITQVRNRVHALGDAHVKSVHSERKGPRVLKDQPFDGTPDMRTLHKAELVEIQLTDTPLPGMEFSSVRRVQEPN